MTTLLERFFRKKGDSAETAKQRLSILVHTSDGFSNDFTRELQEVVRKAVLNFHIEKGLDESQIENLHYEITDQQLMEVQIPIPTTSK
ncbi:hypothetical protein [Photobacterium kishitanii]|uniref:Cell division topological specificity factor n=1 Tax=Photobacterium kishitanii TaxID=318456 RepID=A0A2T3KMM9_9GAMM|nr:hypothetical protein [Photobacterium kishitanii]PSV01053.1 hypothetical protein C9J27_03275 [Photobacterium kishitanii]